MSEQVRPLNQTAVPQAPKPANFAGAGQASQAQPQSAYSQPATKAPFPTSTATQQPVNNTAQATKMAALPATQAAASQQVSTSPKTGGAGYAAAPTPAGPPSAGAGTALAGAVEGFQKQSQGGGAGQDGGQGGQQQGRGSQASYATRPQPLAQPGGAAGIQPQIPVSGITQIQPGAVDPTPERSVASKWTSFLSDMPYFKSRLPGNDPTGDTPRFPAQWLNGPAKPLVPALAFAAGADTQNLSPRVELPRQVEAYPKPSDFWKAQAASRTYDPRRLPSADFDVMALGQYPGATHSNPADDRMKIQVYPPEPQFEAQPV